MNSRIKEIMNILPIKKVDGKMDILKILNSPTIKLIPKIILMFFILISIYLIGYKMYKISIQSIKFGNRNSKGIIFGKKMGKFVYSPTDNEGHILVVGGSGTGKTSSILIPTLQSWNGTSFTIDISGDISSNLHMQNKLVYEPEIKNGVSYDVFNQIDCLSNVNDKAFLIMPETPNLSDAGKFYLTEGRKILTASLIAFYHQDLDFIEICEKIFTSDWKKLFSEIDNTQNKKAIAYIESFHGANETNTAGCKQNCDNYIKLFATNETIKSSIHRSKEGALSFSPERINTHHVFVAIPDNKLELYAPLLHIITAQCLEFFSNRSNHEKTSILFNLDEFASLGKLDIIPALRKLRKKKIRIMVLTQSLADLDIIYGKDVPTAMLNNFNFKIVLSASDTETQKFFAELIGYKKVPHKSTSVDSTGKNKTTTTTMVDELIIKPAELGRLGNKLVLIYPDGHILLKKNFYYKK